MSDNTIIEDLINNGYCVAIINGKECTKLNTFLTLIATKFKFPDYYGNNLDAFDECINDLDWLNATNYALIIYDHEYFMADDTEGNKQYILNLLQEISQEWANVPNFKGEEQLRNKADFKILYR